MNILTNNIKCLVKIIIILLLDGLSILYLEKYTKTNNITNNKPLYDFIHNISSKYIKINNNKVIIKNLLCYLPLLYMIIKHPSYMCNYVNAFIILRLLKILFCWITILPSIKKRKKINNLSDVLYNNSGGNHDLMFSGHTVVLLVGIFSYMKYYKKNLNIYIILYLLISSLSIIIIKDHYSIDVLTSYFVTYSVLKYKNLI